MTKISQYQVDTNISANDQLLGTDAESASVTKKFTVGDLSAYINGQSPGSPGSGTVTSVSGTGSVSGLTLSGTVTSSGELTLGGVLEIDPADITSAIGYTPYNASNPNGFTSFAEPAIFSGGGTPTLASGVTAEEIRTLIGAGSGEGSGTVTSIDATAGTGISVSGVPITTSGTITITNTAPDTGVPAILSNGSVPTLNTGITAEEIRTLIGAGSGTGSIESVSGTAPIISSGGATPVISISAVTTSAAGSMSAADKTKLDGIAAGAQVNVATNIAQGTRTTTTVPITSSTGTGATLSVASTTLAGVMSSADKTKLDGIDTVTDNFVKNTDDTFSSSPKVKQIVTLTQAEYDSASKSSEYLYIIVD
jgi:hypothetical protein